MSTVATLNLAGGVRGQSTLLVYTLVADSLHTVLVDQVLRGWQNLLLKVGQGGKESDDGLVIV